MVQGVRETIENTMSAVRRTITDPNVDAREAMKLVTELSSRKNTSKLRLALSEPRPRPSWTNSTKTGDGASSARGRGANSDTAIRGAIQGQAKTELTPNVARRVAGNIGNPLDAAKGIPHARWPGSTRAAWRCGKGDVCADRGCPDAHSWCGRAKGACGGSGRLAGQPMKDAEAKLIGRMITDGVLQIHQSARQLQKCHAGLAHISRKPQSGNCCETRTMPHPINQTLTGTLMKSRAMTRLMKNRCIRRFYLNRAKIPAPDLRGTP